MKRENKFPIEMLVYYLLISIISMPSIAQQTLPANSIYNVSETHVQTGPCVTKEEMNQIKSHIAQYKKQLEAQGKLRKNRVLAFGPHSFRWPLAPAAHNYNFGYYYISNYVDLESSSCCGDDTSTIMDYNCGNRTYDNDDGYNHDGIDIGIGPFPWTMMDNDDVDVVAAEGGYLFGKTSGNYDRNCIWGGGNSTNKIIIIHSDGSSTFYGHLKNESLTNKIDGDYVQVGEYLAKVGSSGNSTGPHLHFEVQDDLGNIRDPFQNGSCSTGANPTLWANEEPYYNKKIISIFTLSAPWTDSSCDSTYVGGLGISDTVPYKNHFNPGDPIWFSASVRDYTALLPIQLRVLNTSGTAIYSNVFSGSDEHISILTLPLQIIPLAPATTGTYKVECTYNGVTRAHFFTVGCPGSISLASARSSNFGRISGGFIASTDVISSSARNVQYQAEDYIVLNDGFIATNGCEFLARIDNCTTGGTRHEDNALVNEYENFLVKIFPNPFSVGSSLELTVGNEDIISVLLYDLTGRVVKSISKNLPVTSGMHKFSIDGSSLQQGIYQCIITGRDGLKVTERLSVIK